MNQQGYLETLQRAVSYMSIAGLPHAHNTGVVNLTLTFTSTEVDEDEGTAITMVHSFETTIIELTDGTWRIDDIHAWETTTEEAE